MSIYVRIYNCFNYLGFTMMDNEKLPDGKNHVQKQNQELNLQPNTSLKLLKNSKCILNMKNLLLGAIIVAMITLTAFMAIKLRTDKQEGNFH